MGHGRGRARLLVMALAVAGALGGCGSHPGTVSLTFGGSNMEPTLKHGGTVVVTPVQGGYVPRRGDIVEFADPGGWLDSSPDQGPGHLISRVVAIAGDKITCCTADGRLEINGRPVTEPYLNSLRGRCAAELPATAGQRPCDWGVGPVPRGDVFVLGDNRVNSADSRMHLCPPRLRHCTQSPWVPVSAIVGTVHAG